MGPPERELLERLCLTCACVEDVIASGGLNKLTGKDERSVLLLVADVGDQLSFLLGVLSTLAESSGSEPERLTDLLS